MQKCDASTCRPISSAYMWKPLRYVLMALSGYFACIAPAAASSTRCLSGCPLPTLAVVTALRPNSRATAAAAPAATPIPADPAALRPDRSERDLPCFDNMRADYPNPGAQTAFMIAAGTSPRSSVTCRRLGIAGAHDTGVQAES